VKAIARDVQTWSVFSEQKGLYDGQPLPSDGKDKLREFVDRSTH
jgi:hypothetical protein